MTKKNWGEQIDKFQRTISTDTNEVINELRISQIFFYSKQQVA